MIEFKGEIALEPRYYFAKLILLIYLKSLSLTILLMGIPAMIVYFTQPKDSHISLTAMIVLMSLGFLLVCAIILLIILKFPATTYRIVKKDIDEYLPNQVTIDDEMINVECKKTGAYGAISDVKEVIDFGEWYYIRFFRGKCSYFAYCICQKNLITSGSIEEFEQLFKDKIIYKTAR